ncbi:MAG: SCO1664 family protein [Sporichthya sp.]|nr:SCO1664 family protein [Sporichthya sp.]MBA3743872.1 SCO1664 family protein [Sporichthya sp.]
MSEPDSRTDEADEADESGIPAFDTPDLDEAGLLELLTHGELDVIGRMVDASNATLYCSTTLNGVTAACVHKPIAGERPLWDFPDGTLAAREVGAYRVSAATGWNIVPPTVLRDGPWGPGMAQLWIDVDDSVDLGWLVRADDDRLRRIAVLDAVINNADRKGGHLLPTAGGDLYGIDHGVCFAVENKLRTLLWGWAGQPLPEETVEVLEEVAAEWESGLGPALTELLTPRESTATRRRLTRLLRTGIHPEPRQDGWPAVPWPPF